MDRKVAKLELQKQLKRLADTEIYKKALESLKNNIDLINLISYFTDKDYSENMSDEELYFLIKFYNKEIESIKFSDIVESINEKKDTFNKIIIDENDFTQAEIEDYLSKFIDIEKENNNEIILENIITVEQDREYLIAKCSGKTIADLYKKLHYNFSSQREPEYKNYQGFGTIKVPKLYTKNVEEIKRSMLEGTFMSNMITLNILETGEENYTPPENIIGNLIFVREKGSMLDIPDGYHRATAIYQISQEHPEILDRIHMQVKIWHVDLKEINHFVNQEASGSNISAEKVNTLKSDFYNDIINNLKLKGNKKNNALLNRIGDIEQVKSNEKLFAHDTFKQGLEDNIKFSNDRERKLFERYLKEYWNTIIFRFKTEYDDIDKYVSKTALVNNNICLFFNYLAVELSKNDNWEDLLENMLDEIEFDLKKNDIWERIDITSVRYDKKIRKSIYEYARKIFRDFK